MKKIFLSLIGLSVLACADFSQIEAYELERKAAKIREELNIRTPTEKEKKIDAIRKELKIDFDTSSKSKLLGQDTPTTVGSLIASEDDPSISDRLNKAVSKVEGTLGLDDDKGDDFSFSNTLGDFYDTLGLEKGENWGLPAVFGFNEKKKKPRFGIQILGDIEDTGKMMFKGMKYSGTSAEFTSGMMYRSSKMYNTMFGMFEESPFNVFEEEEETSIFDVFEGGNSVLDLFD